MHVNLYSVWTYPRWSYGKPVFVCSLCLLLLVLKALAVLQGLVLIGLLLLSRKGPPLSSDLGHDLSGLETGVLGDKVSTDLLRVEHVGAAGLLGTLLLLRVLLAGLLGLLLASLLGGLLRVLLAGLLSLLLASLLGLLLARLLGSLLGSLLHGLLGVLLGKIGLSGLLKEDQKVLLELSAVAALNADNAGNVTKLLEVAVLKTSLHLGTSESSVIDNTVELTDVALQDSGLGRCTKDSAVEKLEGLVVVLTLGNLLGNISDLTELDTLSGRDSEGLLGGLARKRDSEVGGRDLCTLDVVSKLSISSTKHSLLSLGHVGCCVKVESRKLLRE